MITKINNSRIEIINSGNCFFIYVNDHIFSSGRVESFQDFMKLMNGITTDEEELYKIFDHQNESELVKSILNNKSFKDKRE